MILDTSGSMAGSRIELAKHIARIAVRRMQPHDRIGIVEFYGKQALGSTHAAGDKQD